ncbi:helix-turn-helix domain-containing protein [Staphylococcus sp. LKG3-3]|uniref:helix-turn-helix domain-containing protein n=1 Tax=Staphylococcus sp. LKG3-3 TaxID=3399685 RepID=UPI003D3CF863
MTQKKQRTNAPKEFTDILLNARQDQRLSLRQVAYKSGMSNTYISQLERGLRPTPYPEDLKNLAYALGLDYEMLMKKAGYIENKVVQNDPYDLLMFSDKEAFNNLSDENKERILNSLRDQADYLIDKAKRGK